MTEQERYLITFLNETFGHHESDIDSEAFANRLIQRYPQILAEKVWGGKTYLIQSSNAEGTNYFQDVYQTGGIGKNIEVFIREVPNE